MCGICGIFSISPIKSDFIVRMNNILKHRGPDDEGYLLYDFDKILILTGNDSKVDGQKIFEKNGNLFLGHRRLSILDLSPAGHQPMSDISQKIWIVFNGEIYNYIELREILEKKGYKFKSNTDTEVIINSYLEWGYNCVNYFDGMWAFVIFDSDKKILFGSRDRFGVKPLYFHLDSNLLIFASEIKAIVNSGLYQKQINKKHLADYLIFCYEEQYPLCFFENIYPLKPSYNFEFNLKTFQLKVFRYYKLQFNGKYEKFSEKNLKIFSEKVRELIFETVRLRLRSDVSIGSCLSGGLDSSTIVCVINEIIKKDFIENIGERQKVFTAVFKGEEIDESKWAQIVVNKTKTQWFTTNPTFQELFQDLEDLVYYQDIPFGSTSIYAQYRVMKLAKENGVKVLLDGQGGDEVFTGYLLYYPIFFQELARNLDFFSILNELKHYKNFSFPLKEILKIIKKAIKLKYLIKVFFKKIAIKEKKEFFEDFFPDEFIFNKQFFDYAVEKVKEFLRNPDYFLNEFLYKQLKYGLINLLRYEDRNSMRFSIESRVPFSDGIKLIEYVYSLPSVYKIHNGLSKYILRESIKDILPPEIYKRTDKIGFQTPEKKWFRDNKKLVLEILDYDLLKEFIDVEKVKSEFDKLDSVKIWRLLNLSLWKKVFFK